MASSYEPKTPLGRFVNELEETVIALLLGVMTLITFINVILRYGFNTGLIWGLEMVTFLFGLYCSVRAMRLRSQHTLA